MWATHTPRGSLGAGATLVLLLAAAAHVTSDQTVTNNVETNEPQSPLAQLNSAHEGDGFRSEIPDDTTEPDFRLFSELEDVLDPSSDPTSVIQQEEKNDTRRSGLPLGDLEYTAPKYSLAPESYLGRGGPEATIYLRRFIPPNELIYLDTIHGAEDLIKCTREGEFYSLQTSWNQCLVCVCVRGGRPVCAICDCKGGTRVSLPPIASSVLNDALLEALMPSTPAPLLAASTPPALPLPILPIPLNLVPTPTLPHLPKIMPIQKFPSISNQPPLLPLKPVSKIQPILPQFVADMIKPEDNIPELSVGGTGSCTPLPTGVAFDHPLNPCKTCLCQAPADGSSGIKITCIDNNECVNPIAIPELVESPPIPKPIPTLHCNKFPKNVVFPHPTDPCRQCQCFATASAFGISNPHIMCIPISDCKLISNGLYEPSHATEFELPTLKLPIPSEPNPLLPLLVKNIPSDLSPPRLPLPLFPHLNKPPPAIPLFVTKIPSEPPPPKLPLPIIPEFNIPSLKKNPSPLHLDPLLPNVSSEEREPEDELPNIKPLVKFPSIQNIPALPIRPSYELPSEPILEKKIPPSPSILNLLPGAPISTENIPELPITPAISVEPYVPLHSMPKEILFKAHDTPKIPSPIEQLLNPDYLAVFPELNKPKSILETEGSNDENPLPWPPITVPALPESIIGPVPESVQGPLPGPPPHKSCRPYPPNKIFQHPWDECQLCRCSEASDLGHTSVEVNCYTKPSCCIEIPMIVDESTGLLKVQGPITRPADRKVMYTDARCLSQPLNIPFVLDCEICVCRLVHTSVVAHCTPQPKCKGRLTGNHKGESQVSATLEIPVNGALKTPISPGVGSGHGVGQGANLPLSTYKLYQALLAHKLLGSRYNNQNELSSTPRVPIKNFITDKKPSALQQAIPPSLLTYHQYPYTQNPTFMSGQQKPDLFELSRRYYGTQNYNMNYYPRYMWPGNITQKPISRVTAQAHAESESNNAVAQANSVAQAKALDDVLANNLYFPSTTAFPSFYPSFRQLASSPEEGLNSYKFEGDDKVGPTLAASTVPTSTWLAPTSTWLAPTSTWLPLGQPTWDTTTPAPVVTNKKALEEVLGESSSTSQPVTRQGRGLCQYDGDMYHARCQACSCHLDDNRNLYSMCFGNPCQ